MLFFLGQALSSFQRATLISSFRTAPLHCSTDSVVFWKFYNFCWIWINNCSQLSADTSQIFRRVLFARLVNYSRIKPNKGHCDCRICMRQRKNEQYSSCILENILCVGKYSDIEKGLIKFARKNRVTQTVEIGFQWVIQLIILYFSDK